MGTSSEKKPDRKFFPHSIKSLFEFEDSFWKIFLGLCHSLLFLDKLSKNAFIDAQLAMSKNFESKPERPKYSKCELDLYLKVLSVAAGEAYKSKC